ncbi:hypothetical protein CAPTEDRAFT_168270 [Capitella teleta]|uniref:F-box domain-containing protein n=1 Tax=Capitella teleta TaxID=283909 RepID=R7UIW2_CAPTE|nr:hypothetical protein CAPTEDRAFT_168270 [Capitella teleta]|eukprot:ELU06028.1 hypothetical protein CAPTEDRAFT_168270 [Capitella teleta]
MLSRSVSVSLDQPFPAADNSPLQLLQLGEHAAALVCLLLFIFHLVMSSARHKGSKPSRSSACMIQRPGRSKPRSISVSADLDCPGRSSGVSRGVSSAAAKRSALQDYLRLCEERNRTISATEGVESFLLSCSPMLSMGKALATLKPQQFFPFQQLPADCMLKIFSFLSPTERGQASQVCSQWRALIKSASLWSSVDLTTFPLCTKKSARHECTELCYSAYRTRMRKFMKYLVSVKPALRSLQFAYDIGEYKDGWLECLQALIKASRCLELEVAHLNWKETPIRPFWSESITWSTSDYNELMHRHRHRQRLFVNFFDQFTAAAPNVKQLVLPFDWSPRSLKALTRLKRLENVVLEKYYVFQSMEQESLDTLLRQLSSLRRLILEVWTPSGRGLLFFHLASASLEYIDVSQCRGFYVGSVSLPKVTVFKISRHPWNGPLVVADSITVPCIYEVLCEGAPNLRQLNEHTLRADWRESPYEELDVVLKAICSCRVHKSGWVM